MDYGILRLEEVEVLVRITYYFLPLSFLNSKFVKFVILINIFRNKRYTESCNFKVFPSKF